MSTETGGTERKVLPVSLGVFVKYTLIAVFDALVVAAFPLLVAGGNTTLLVMLVLSAILINVAYLTPRAAPLKWLAPGLILMAVFVVYPVLYTAYISLTNFATGNVLTKEQVINQFESQVIRSEGESVTLDLTIYQDSDGQLAFLLTGPDATYFGTPRDRSEEVIEDPLLDPEALGADLSAGPPDQIGDYTRLQLAQLFGIQNEIVKLVLDIPGLGVAEVQTAQSARLIAAGSRYTYDESDDTIYDAQLDRTCTADIGNFICEDGQVLSPGWRTLIGFENYSALFQNQRVRGPLIQVFIWNMVFAVASVALTFALGLALANALQEGRLRGRALYRSIFIIPYAVPAFLSVLVWRGLLNTRFGQVNGMLANIGIDAVPWLTTGDWAKISLILVNVWLGFPYMYLICTGGLQAVPEELKEAARVDGASAWRVFRTITIPLLLVSTAPLLIGSFAFNFNNFVLIFLLTRGGPPLPNAAVPVGETDILISFVFDLVVSSGRGSQFALGSAIVVIIFFIVATLSAFSFRFTKRLEQIYGDA